jgi:outer membrane protein assembly factor BamB
MRFVLRHRLRFTAGTTLALLAALLASACSAEDKKAEGRSWPMLGGSPGRNLANTVEKGIPDTFSVAKGKQKNVKWVADLGTHSYGGPVVAGGKIFVGTNNDKPRDPGVKGDKGIMMCFRESDGEFLWQAVHDKLSERYDPARHGVLSTPVVEGDRLYYVSNRCELICADTEGDPKTKKAKILWKLDMMGELGVEPNQASNCSPLIVGDLVFAVTSNGVDHDFKVSAPKAPSFVAVDKKTGKVAWKDNSPGDKIMDGQWSNPAAAEVNGVWQVIFPGGDGWLYSFEAKTGKLIWKFDCNPKNTKFQPGGHGTKGYLVATPVVHENKLYVAVGQQPDYCRGVGHLWCIDITKTPKNKDKDLSPVNDNFDPKAEVNKDSGLVWHYGGAIEPKPKDGGREAVFEQTMSTVAVHDGLVYAAELSSVLHCLDAKTGKKYWDFDMLTDTWCSPYYVDGKVYIGANNANLFIFRHGKELKDPEKIDLLESVQMPPVAANGVLYVSNGAKLFAIAAK